MSNSTTHRRSTIPSYESAKGNIRFTLTNDFMFHVVFEENESALIKLLCSLLHMNPAEVISLEVMNPIDYGQAIDRKKVILDLKLLVNDSRIINIELQVLDKGNWPDRSIIYLCRCYDNVLKGQKYDSVMPAHQISIIDFDLPETGSEFFSTHHISNDRTGTVFSGNFELSVLNLSQIDHATAEDKNWLIDCWAKLFKATTWEELRMIASQDKEMTTAAKALFEKNQDMYARAWAHSREMALFDERCLKAQKQKALDELKKLNKDLEKTNKDLEKTNKDLEKTNKDLEKTNKENDRLRAKLIANGIDPDE